MSRARRLRILLGALPLQFAFGMVYSWGAVALAGSIAAGRHAIPDLPGAAGGLVTAAYAVAAPIQVPVVSLLAAAFGWLAALRLQGTVMLAVAALTLALMPAVPAPAPGP